MPLPTENSRLLNVPIVQTVDGQDIYEIRRPLPYVPVNGMRQIVTEGNEKLWDIATEFYGDPLLYWAIADYNDIHDVTTEVFAGMTLLIPPRSYIDEYLSSILR
jgi:hypothetical protein